MPEFVMIDLAATLAALPSNVIPHIEPPREFRIFRAGRNSTRKGVFLFDSEAAASVQAKSEAWGVEHTIDYGHAMVATADAPDPSEAGKAAGWFKLALRNGELWAVDVRWTPAAARAISQGEWRYVSPYFQHDKAGRVLELLNVAITNLPATNHLDPLVALAMVADESIHITESRSMDKALLVALGLAETATEKDAMEHAVRLTAEHATLSARVKSMETAALAAEITAAVNAGKLAPAQVEWATKLGAVAPESLRSFLSTAPVIVKMETPHANPGAAQGNTGTPATLTADDENVARQLGLSVADMAKSRAAFATRSN
jgi:phage I-like protein